MQVIACVECRASNRKCDSYWIAVLWISRKACATCVLHSTTLDQCGREISRYSYQTRRPGALDMSILDISALVPARPGANSLKALARLDHRLFRFFKDNQHFLRH